jgi:hypothetical protein
MMAESGTLAVFQDALMEIVQDHDFKRSTLRFLLVLFVEIEPANFLTGWSPRGLAKKYAMDYSSALSATKLLIAKGWLRQLDNGTGVQRYRLSPHLCWRGRPWKARVAQKNWDAEAALARLSTSWDNPND